MKRTLVRRWTASAVAAEPTILGPMDRLTLRPLLLMLGLAALLALCWLQASDHAAQRYADAGLKRSLAAFALARALDAAVSVVQGTEVSAQLMVGVTSAPGQALDPLNDLIEQFASLMLGASVAFGVQRLLVQIGAWWGLSLLLTLLALAWCAYRWRDRAVPPLLSKVLLLALAVRFAMPLVALGSDGVYRLFMADRHAAAHADIERSIERITTLLPPAAEPKPDKSIADQVRRWLTQVPDIDKRFEDVKASAERAVEQMIDLIVVFLMQTLLLPLAFLWLWWQGLRALAGWSGRQR